MRRLPITGKIFAASFLASLSGLGMISTALAASLDQPPPQTPPTQSSVINSAPLGTPAASASAAPSPSSRSQSAASADPKDKIVCRTRIEIGTRLGKRRECLSLRQWEEIRAQSNAETKRMQRNMGDKRT